MVISLRELIWQDYLILSFCVLLIIINLIMSILFLRKYFTKKSTMQLALGLFQLISGYVALVYGLHTMLTINEIWDGILEDAYLIGMIVLPLLLIRVANELCKTKPSLAIEIIFFGTKLACFIPALLIPTHQYIGYLVFLPLLIMLAFVIYFLIYQPHKVKNELHIEDHVLKVALDIVGVSAVLFIIVLFTFALHAIFGGYSIMFSGFLMYFGFLITVYLGYYNPLWWRRIVSRKKDEKYCYGEFDDCLNLIKEEEKQEKMLNDMEDFEELKDIEDIRDIDELDDVEELKDLIDGLENLRELGDIDPDEESE